MITSVDLMIATTLSPSRSPRPSTEPRVIAETTSLPPPISTVTSAITSPYLMLVIVPFSWLRALNSIPESSLLPAGSSSTAGDRHQFVQHNRAGARDVVTGESVDLVAEGPARQGVEQGRDLWALARIVGEDEVVALLGQGHEVEAER